ncbi:hypothetical protein RUM44_001323 [Polyplax serrata]|uniref:Uncharacterized protein n=1 Tax=Polyplax serrata TaxID=468196 RepID=A0ABR1AJR5_POLSC
MHSTAVDDAIENGHHSDFLTSNASESFSPSFVKTEKNIAKRGSDRYIQPHGTFHSNSQSERSDQAALGQYENNSNATEPQEEGDSPPISSSKPENNWMTTDGRTHKTHRVSRLCRRNKELRDVSQISVNQLVQGTIRKYHLERGIFHQLLELKRLQIRAGRANEQVLVKRLADEYERSCASLGMRHYNRTYKFKEFERFLYDQLKSLNRSHSFIPDMKSYDDIDALSGIMKKSRFKILSEVPPYEPLCSCLTQRCHHTTRAYTSIPCSAYVASIRRNKSHKSKKESFLPHIEQFQPYRSAREKFCDSSPTTLELIQGNNKQVIELPPTQSDRNKKYYITFTIKSAQNFKDGDGDDHTDDDLAHGSRKIYFKHRHAKSV